MSICARDAKGYSITFDGRISTLDLKHQLIRPNLMKQKLHQHVRDQFLDRWLARGAVVIIVGLQTVIVNDLSFGPWWLGPAAAINTALGCPRGYRGRVGPRRRKAEMGTPAGHRNDSFEYGTKLCSTLSAHQSNLPRSRRHREDATS